LAFGRLDCSERMLSRNRVVVGEFAAGQNFYELAGIIKLSVELHNMITLIIFCDRRRLYIGLFLSVKANYLEPIGTCGVIFKLHS